MNEIRISLNEVKEIANQIKVQSEQMNDTLNEVKTLINELNEYWLSEASNNYQYKFNEFSKLFETIKNDIDTYASFLNHTADSYESIESTIAANAKEIY